MYMYLLVVDDDDWWIWWCVMKTWMEVGVWTCDVCIRVCVCKWWKCEDLYMYVQKAWRKWDESFPYCYIVLDIFSNLHACVRVRIIIWIHRYIQGSIQRYTDPYKNTQIHTQIHTSIQRDTDPYKITQIHDPYEDTQIHTQIYTKIHRSKHIYTNPYKDTQIRTNMHRSIHRSIHEYTDPYSHTQTKRTMKKK